MTPDPTPAANHYGTGDLIAPVQDALRLAGLGDGLIAWDALIPLDQFHVGGVAATADLAGRLGIEPGASLLDIGCGLGGPARHLAAVHGCSVIGIDLNRPFVDLATMLTARTGLSGQVRHMVGDATQLSFEPGRFDLAWTQHVAMNIADRHGLYARVHAALRPGGRFAIYDVVAGQGGLPHFPVPWARDPADSVLLTADATRDALEACGFTVLEWRDTTEAGIQWAETQAATGRARPGHLKGLALPLVMGPGFPEMAANLGRNLHERRVRLLQAIVGRPA